MKISLFLFWAKRYFQKQRHKVIFTCTSLSLAIAKGQGDKGPEGQGCVVVWRAACGVLACALEWPSVAAYSGPIQGCIQEQFPSSYTLYNGFEAAMLTYEPATTQLGTLCHELNGTKNKTNSVC
jgi:hypothetical protein